MNVSMIRSSVLINEGLHLLPHSFGLCLGSLVAGYVHTLFLFPAADPWTLLHIDIAGCFIEQENTPLSTSPSVSFHSLVAFPSSLCERIRRSSKSGSVSFQLDLGWESYL